MSALSIQPTYPIFTETDGQPLEDGYIWIGAANLDPQGNQINVYWDAALTQLAGQPIRTQGGYPVNSGTPARLYVNSDYSIRVMNKNGSAVYSAPAATERYSEEVISSLNATQVIYDPAGPGAVPTTVDVKLSQVISVFDFMTPAQIADVQAGTLAINVGPAIQAACDYAWNAPAGTGRRVVYFPNGKYRVNATIGLAGVSLLGESMSGSEIYYYGINACFTNTTGENFIQNLTLDGTNANAGSSIGVLYDTTLRHTFRKNIVRGFFRGIKIIGTAAFNNFFTENYFLGNSIHVYTEAIGSGQFPTTCWFTENEFNNASNSNYAIYLQDSEGFTFEKNTIQNNDSKYAIFIYYFSGLTNSYMNHRIINNWFEENGNSQVGSADIKVLGSFGAVKGILIEKNQHYTTAGNNPTYGVDAENTDGLTVQNNTWNLGSPWTYLKKTGIGNKNWIVSNPLVPAAQEMKQHLAVFGKSAGSAQTVNAGANDVILFNNAINNYSGLWNTSTGEFTCAAKGTYEFKLSITFENSTVAQQFDLTVLVNNSLPSITLTKQCIKQITNAETFEFVGYVTINVADVVTFKCSNTGGSARNIGVSSQGSIALLDYIP